MGDVILLALACFFGICGYRLVRIYSLLQTAAEGDRAMELMLLYEAHNPESSIHGYLTGDE